MAFSIIVNSTATIPYDVNDNFTFVSRGSITPKAGVELEETTSSYNIGSATNLFNNSYFSGSISCNTISGISGYIFEKVFSTVITATATSIEITGLNGDDDKNYYLIFNGTTAPQTISGANLYIFFNNDSSSSYSMIFNRMWSGQIVGGFLGGSGITLYFYPGEIKTYTYILKFRSSSSKFKTGYVYGNNIYDPSYGIFNWNNTTDYISSIKLINQNNYFFQPGTGLMLYKYGVA